jgi:hypothetical protein
MPANLPRPETPESEAARRFEADMRDVERMMLEQIRAAHGFAMRLLGDATERLEDDFRNRDSEHAHWYSTTNGTATCAGLNGLQAIAAAQRGALVIERIRHGIRHAVTVTRVDATDAEGKGAK